jgi:hypothetical protein
MAAKASASGELYFIGEKDPMTGEDTQFVKIGIVREKDDRDTAYRVKEHQTGNPRLLHAVEVIKTPIVERLETTMHGKFAPMRLSGEWFYFSLEQRNMAISTAKAYAEQAFANVKYMELAEQWKSTVSEGEVMTPFDELIAVHAQLIEQRAIVKACAELLVPVKNVLAIASKQGLDVDKLIDVQTKKGIEKFNEQAFKAAYPDEWAKYIQLRTQFKGSFVVKDPKASRPDAFEVLPELAELNFKINESLEAGDGGLPRLHKLYLDILTIQRPAEWEVAFLEDRIKSECGSAPGIQGVCTWNRVSEQKEVFNKNELKNRNHELYSQFATVGEDTEAAVVVKDLGFTVE